jgi:hypothetical protein
MPVTIKPQNGGFGNPFRRRGRAAGEGQAVTLIPVEVTPPPPVRRAIALPTGVSS